MSKREKISLLYGAKTMNKGEYYARKQILELFNFTIGNMIVTLAFGLGVGLVVLLFALIVRSILSKK